MRVAAADADVVVMAAAVADYTPAVRLDGKIQKSDGPLELHLVRTPTSSWNSAGREDRARRPVLVGFAAESGDPVARGREKLARKGADLIVANDISRPDAGFESDMNAATFISVRRNRDVSARPQDRPRRRDPRSGRSAAASQKR